MNEKASVLTVLAKAMAAQQPRRHSVPSTTTALAVPSLNACAVLP